MAIAAETRTTRYPARASTRSRRASAASLFVIVAIDLDDEARRRSEEVDDETFDHGLAPRDLPIRCCVSLLATRLVDECRRFPV
jgi:hypothetical protein